MKIKKIRGMDPIHASEKKIIMCNVESVEKKFVRSSKIDKQK